MISVFDRIRNALADGKMLSKTDLFIEAQLPKTPSSKALFEILVENNKLIPMGKGRARKYCLPLILDKCELPQEGEYKFTQKGDGKIHFQFNQEDPIIFPSYDECAIYIKRRLCNG
jgi:hypothetical protein